MNTNNENESLESLKETEESSSEETHTIIFETESGEKFAEVELSQADYVLLSTVAEEHNLSLEEYLIGAIESQLTGMVEAIDVEEGYPEVNLGELND